MILHSLSPFFQLTRDFDCLLGARRKHPLMGLTALHEVQVSYGHHYRRTWEVNPTQQQRRESKAPSALTGGFTAQSSIPTNEINAPNGLTAVHPQEHPPMAISGWNGRLARRAGQPAQRFCIQNSATSLCGLRDLCVKKKPKSIYFDRFRSEKIGFDLPTTSNQEILSHQMPENDIHDILQHWKPLIKCH